MSIRRGRLLLDNNSQFVSPNDQFTSRRRVKESGRPPKGGGEVRGKTEPEHADQDI